MGFLTKRLSPLRTGVEGRGAGPSPSLAERDRVAGPAFLIVSWKIFKPKASDLFETVQWVSFA